MKKKYFVVIASLIIIVLIVAFGLVFNVRDVSVVFTNKTVYASETDILNAAGNIYKKNIFSINETEIKRSIAATFDDNSIFVTNIVRSFPDKVTIYVKERIPVFKMSVYTSDGDDFVAADKDFQRQKIQKETEFSHKLIDVTGYVVRDTFNVKECIALRNLALQFIDLEISEEALPYFIKEIHFEDNFMQVRIAETNAILFINIDNVREETTTLYNRYINTDFTARVDAIFRI